MRGNHALLYVPACLRTVSLCAESASATQMAAIDVGDAEMTTSGHRLFMHCLEQVNHCIPT